MNSFKNNIFDKKNNLKNILMNKNIIKLDSIYNDIYSQTINYKYQLNELFTQINNFVIENISNYYNPFINGNTKPLLLDIINKYSNLSDYTLEIINKEIDKFEDYSPQVEKILDINNTIENITNLSNQYIIYLLKIIKYCGDSVYDTIEELIKPLLDLYSQYVFIKENMNKLKELKEMIEKNLNENKTIIGDKIIEEYVNSIINNNYYLNQEMIDENYKEIRKLRIKKFQKENNLRRNLDDVGFKFITDLIKQISQTINDFSDSIINKNYYLLSGKLSNFNDMLNYNIEHIKDPLNYLISQIDSYLTPDKIEKFKNKVLNDMNKVINLINIYKNGISDKYNILFNSMSRFKEIFSKSIVQNLFEISLDTIITFSVNLILDVLIPFDTNFYFKKPLSIKIPFSLFGLPITLETGFVAEVFYEIKVESKHLRLYMGGTAGSSLNLEVNLYVNALALKFGAKVYGELGKGAVSLFPTFNMKKFTIGIKTGIMLRTGEFGFGVYIEYLSIHFIKIYVKIWFVKIPFLIPIIQMKMKWIYKKVFFAGVEYIGIYDKELK